MGPRYAEVYGGRQAMQREDPGDNSEKSPDAPWLFRKRGFHCSLVSAFSSPKTHKDRARRHQRHTDEDEEGNVFLEDEGAEKNGDDDAELIDGRDL